MARVVRVLTRAVVLGATAVTGLLGFLAALVAGALARWRRSRRPVGSDLADPESRARFDLLEERLRVALHEEADRLAVDDPHLGTFE